MADIALDPNMYGTTVSAAGTLRKAAEPDA